jgi:predicted transcriptional regulator YdeE
MENKPIMEKSEVVKCGPYRFIGKSFYGRAGQSDELCGAVWELDWVFKAIDGLKEYATEDIHDAALVTWDKYDEKNKLMGYTVGRFMKADTPVPDNMDYIDIPEGYIAKGFIRGGNDSIAKQMLIEEIKRQDIYEAATWIWSAEIFPNRVADSQKDFNVRTFGCYIACELKNPKE